MRLIVIGIGAIGGTVSAALAQSGADVLAVARGAQLAAMQDGGLTLRSPTRTFTVDVPVVGQVADIEFRADDMILIAVKGQHTEGVLDDLRAAGVTDQPIFFLQNGVSNELRALRYFPNVHAVTVMMPALYATPGEIIVNSVPRLGLFYTGRCPLGTDGADKAFADVMIAADIATKLQDNAMAPKYGKLLMNLANIVGAAFGQGAGPEGLRERLKDEAKAVFKAAGIAWEDVGLGHPDRKAHMNFQLVEGVENYGTSTAQSLMRGTGSIETDWLNGEIVMLGRQHNVPTPANAYFTQLAHRMLRDGIEPGSVTEDEVMAGIRAFGG